MTLSMLNPLGPWIWRWSADTIPLVSVRSSPNGLPIASVGSPTWTVVESPSTSGWTSGTPAMLTFSSARSLLGSWSTTDRRAGDVVLELDADAVGAVGALDHVIVGEDVAGVVDQEARPGRDAAFLRGEQVERILHLLDDLRANEHDAGRVALVDGVRRSASAAPVDAGWAANGDPSMIVSVFPCPVTPSASSVPATTTPPSTDAAKCERVGDFIRVPVWEAAVNWS